jgi:uncharacterized protein YajQ (UPF0234 family)
MDPLAATLTRQHVQFSITLSATDVARALKRVYLSVELLVQYKTGPNMPSFDVVSDFDSHEANNAVDQASREVNTRFDFKGTGSRFEIEEAVITMISQSDFQLKQMLDILRQKLSKRGINIACLEEQDPELSNSEARQKIILRRGIDADRARKLVKQIKTEKLKVQTAIQGDKLRVNGKKRDDLQKVIAMLKDFDVDLPLQYENFRD